MWSLAAARPVNNEPTGRSQWPPGERPTRHVTSPERLTSTSRQIGRGVRRGDQTALRKALPHCHLRVNLPHAEGIPRRALALHEEVRRFDNHELTKGHSPERSIMEWEWRFMLPGTAGRDVSAATGRHREPPLWPLTWPPVNGHRPVLRPVVSSRRAGFPSQRSLVMVTGLWQGQGHMRAASKWAMIYVAISARSGNLLTWLRESFQQVGRIADIMAH